MNKARYSTDWFCAAVILLSFVLAVGFLLIILSCALWQNWLPLLVGTYHFLNYNVKVLQSEVSPHLRPCTASQRSLLSLWW